MMKKSFKNRSAVSPVIATILMVAITVVLAAVLYVMVMGFGSGPSPTPTASLTKESTAVAHQEKISVASITEAQIYTNMKISVALGSSVGSVVVGSGSLTLSPAVANVTAISFVDVAGDGKVSGGDYFLITTSAATAGNTITVTLLYGGEAASVGAVDYTAL